MDVQLKQEHDDALILRRRDDTREFLEVREADMFST